VRVRTQTGRFLVGVVLLLFIAGYAYYQSRDFVLGPRITFTYPEAGATVTESLTTIEGVANNVSYITMNGGEIFVDEYGQFSETLLLAEGYNIIEVVIRDRFDRTQTETLELVYDPNL